MSDTKNRSESRAVFCLTLLNAALLLVVVADRFDGLVEKEIRDDINKCKRCKEYGCFYAVAAGIEHDFSSSRNNLDLTEKFQIDVSCLPVRVEDGICVYEYDLERKGMRQILFKERCLGSLE